MEIPSIPEIPEEEQTPTVKALLFMLNQFSRIAHELSHLNQKQTKEITNLKVEIAKLKGQKGPPKIPPSNKGKKSKGKAANDAGKNRQTPQGPSLKRKRFEDRILQPKIVPVGSRFKGYQDFTIEDIVVEAVAIRFRIATYTTPDGKTIRAELPPEFQNCKHFSPGLRAYILLQYHQCQVTQPLLLSQLHEFGVKISAGELNTILSKEVDIFHSEKVELLEAGITHSDYIHTDDTGARHDGKNGVCTVIGSPLFTYFESTSSKSRINFLEVLRGAYTDYRLTAEALNYGFERGLKDDTQSKLELHEGRVFKTKNSWENFLKKQSIISVKSVRIATESALLGSVIFHGLPVDMHILSDAAPQFSILLNALCWIHEERHYCKLIPCSEMERVEIEKMRDEIWRLYRSLKEFRKLPTVQDQVSLEQRFDEVFGMKYQSEALNSLLKNTRSRKKGLLRVLSYSAVPLDNNGAERDIREYVKRRKISGSTRSEAGRRARDTFASLKKTCGKLRVRFWEYLLDRLTGAAKVPILSFLISQKSRESPILAST
jgi:hypothetical protein